MKIIYWYRIFPKKGITTRKISNHNCSYIGYAGKRMNVTDSEQLKFFYSSIWEHAQMEPLARVRTSHASSTSASRVFLTTAPKLRFLYSATLHLNPRFKDGYYSEYIIVSPDMGLEGIWSWRPVPWYFVLTGEHEMLLPAANPPLLLSAINNITKTQLLNFSFIRDIDMVVVRWGHHTITIFIGHERPMVCNDTHNGTSYILLFTHNRTTQPLLAASVNTLKIRVARMPNSI